MAFGIKKEELAIWKSKVKMGEIAFLTHYWLDERFPSCFPVTKVCCSNIPKLLAWVKQYGLKETFIHYDDDYPHFDLFGKTQKDILQHEGQWDHIKRFGL